MSKDMAIDSSGNFYTACNGITKFSSNGTYLGTFNKTQMGSVTSLAFDNSGNLWAATWGGSGFDSVNSIKKLDSAGNV